MRALAQSPFRPGLGPVPGPFLKIFHDVPMGFGVQAQCRGFFLSGPLSGFFQNFFQGTKFCTISFRESSGIEQPDLVGRGIVQGRKKNGVVRNDNLFVCRDTPSCFRRSRSV